MYWRETLNEWRIRYFRYNGRIKTKNAHLKTEFIVGS